MPANVVKTTKKLNFTALIFRKLYISDMNWLLLIIAGLFEVGFASCLGKAKETTGTTSAYWMGGFFVCLTISMVLLYKATQQLPIGTAYAVWTGVGAAGTVLVGIFVFKEPSDFWRLFFLTTLIASIIGLKVVSH
tara:strand:- start:28850 stop:29254 length:405 start_codon:yes stop_codon:yes gene_type:complete